MSLRRLFVFALLLNVVWVVSVMAQEEKPHWSYEAEGETSPSMWGQLSPELCAVWDRQNAITD
jgi:carbonic anhydrase